jgi:demethylmenaquinone methyltransferase/2-methoxy-6-polyprenyl-1,4-benzoquinol methylase
MAFSKDKIVQIYKKRAENYDITANLYYLFGFREQAYRHMAVQSLNLEDGDTVIEIACGTGMNFKLLQEKVGPEGQIIGVDITPEMLAKARQRVDQNGWENVELVRSDASSYQFPDRVDGIISTFAITLIPDFDEVIKRGAEVLNTGSRFVVLDFKSPIGRNG